MKRYKHVFRVILMLILFAAILHSPSFAQSPVPNESISDTGSPDKLQSSLEGLPEDFYIENHAYTGKVRLLSSRSLTSLPQPKALAPGITALEAAQSFLDSYGGLFGLYSPRQQLVAKPGK